MFPIIQYMNTKKIRAGEISLLIVAVMTMLMFLSVITEFNVPKAIGENVPTSHDGISLDYIDPSEVINVRWISAYDEPFNMVTMSPNGQWIAYQQNGHLYIYNGTGPIYETDISNDGYVEIQVIDSGLCSVYELEHLQIILLRTD